MEKTIEINGKEYVQKTKDYKPSEHVCVIADRGWIFEGYRTNPDTYELTEAHVVRKWSNGRGIGGLAKDKYKHEYTLDEIGSISIHPQAVIATIPLEWQR